MIEENKSKFKKGDFLYSEDENNKNIKFIIIFKKEINDKKVINNMHYFAMFNSFKEVLLNYRCIGVGWKYASDAQKQELLDALHKEGKDWDADNCEIVSYKI